jgi:hypothetical protein
MRSTITFVPTAPNKTFPVSTQCWSQAWEQEPPLGAHLATSRRGYTHHGIYIGLGKVMHYAGLSESWRAGPVEEVTLLQFASGHPVEIVDHPESIYSAQEIVRRARRRAGEHDYRLLTNNCEHFCNWCVSGLSRSAQIERASALPALALDVVISIVNRLPRILGRSKQLSPQAICAG